jgi:6,7-dimethyl-8-ribityllumazine synthase
MSLKGPTTQQHDGSGLRVAIIHARWNSTVIEPLIAGAKEKLLASGASPTLWCSRVRARGSSPLRCSGMFFWVQISSRVMGLGSAIRKAEG